MNLVTGAYKERPRGEYETIQWLGKAEHAEEMVDWLKSKLGRSAKELLAKAVGADVLLTGMNWPYYAADHGVLVKPYEYVLIRHEPAYSFYVSVIDEATLKLNYEPVKARTLQWAGRINA